MSAITRGPVILALGMCFCVSAVSAPPTLYVSTLGDDAWSGAIADPRPDVGDGPFATLQRARDELRALRRAGAETAGAVVYVRGGEYFMEETFSLNAIDSGVEGAPVHYMAFGDEEPILIGGAELKGFEPWRDEIMRLDLKNIGREGMTFAQLFHDGKRQVLARYPNYDHENPYAGGFLYAADTDAEEPRQRLHFEPGTLKKWQRPASGSVWVFPGVNYWNNIVPIEKVDHEAGVISLVKPTSYGINKGDRYFVRGLLEELDAPGEWYLDAEDSMLYFWPPGDLDKRVSAPVVGTIVQIAKDPSQAEWPHDIVLQGFTIEGCDGTAVQLTNTRRCRVMASTIRNASTGISVSTGKDNIILGNDIYQTGSSAVTMYTGNRSPEQPDGNRVENNYIHHTGYFSKTSAAVACYGVANTVSHNLIHDCPRIAVVYNGNDHVIEYNHLRHMNLETQDSGATYCLGRDWTNRGHVVRYNYIHDTLGYGRHGGTQWHTPFFTFGIYLDDWSSGQHVYGNIVAKSFLAGIDVHSGRDNLIENNVIYDCAREQFRYQAWPTSHRMLPDMLKQVQDWAHSGLYPGLSRHRDAVDDSTMSYNVFQRNIISYGRPGSTLYAVGGLDYATTQHDHNIIHRWDGEPDSSFEKMRENGLDTHSIVADPMLVDPENGDFRLRPESPALKMGFEQIPVEKIGPYESPLRASWPIVQAEGAREHPHRQVEVRRAKAPAYDVVQGGAITLDGKLTADEWSGLDRAKAMVLAQHPSGDKGAEPISYAWLKHDGEYFYVGLLNLGAATLSDQPAWGGADGAEVCIQDASGSKPGPVYVLQGFAGGHFQSTDHAGAPAADVKRLGEATGFAASIGDGQWSGEWRIPFAEARIAPEAGKKLRFNIGVRKTSGAAPWVVWVGTGSSNYLVQDAGEIVLK